MLGTMADATVPLMTPCTVCLLMPSSIQRRDALTALITANTTTITRPTAISAYSSGLFATTELCTIEYDLLYVQAAPPRKRRARGFPHCRAPGRPTGRKHKKARGTEVHARRCVCRVPLYIKPERFSAPCGAADCFLGALVRFPELRPVPVLLPERFCFPLRRRVLRSLPVRSSEM